MAAVYGSLEPQNSGIPIAEDFAEPEDDASTTVLNRRRRRAIAFSVAGIASLAVVATVGLTSHTSVSKLPAQSVHEGTIDEPELRYVSMTTGTSIPGNDQTSRPPKSDSHPSYSFSGMFGGAAKSEEKEAAAPGKSKLSTELCVCV